MNKLLDLAAFSINPIFYMLAYISTKRMQESVSFPVDAIWKIGGSVMSSPSLETISLWQTLVRLQAETISLIWDPASLHSELGRRGEEDSNTRCKGVPIQSVERHLGMSRRYATRVEKRHSCYRKSWMHCWEDPERQLTWNKFKKKETCWRSHFKTGFHVSPSEGWLVLYAFMWLSSEATQPLLVVK